MLIAPGDEKHQRYPDADGAVGNIEGGKTRFIATTLLQIKPQEIHDMLADDAVHEISHDAADDQAEGKLAKNRVRVEMAAAKK
jgi:hypothetical protein